MSVCRTLVSSERSNYLQKVNENEYIQFLEWDFDTAKKIVGFINSKTKSFNIELKNSILGAGSFGVVYKGTLNKKEKVAVKFIKITREDIKRQNEKEVELQNKAYKIVKPNNIHLAPRIFSCDFICLPEYSKTAEVCQGVQVIIMERKFPFDLELYKFTAKEYAELLGQAIRNNELLYKNGLYMFDLKPENNVIDEDLNLRIIDFTPDFSYKKYNESNSVFGKLGKTKFEKIVGTIANLIYVLRFIKQVHKLNNKSVVNEFTTRINKNREFLKFVFSLSDNYPIIYKFLTDYEKLENRNDKELWKGIYHYSIKKTKDLKKSDYFPLLLKEMKKYLPIKDSKKGKKHTLKTNRKKIPQKKN